MKVHKEKRYYEPFYKFIQDYSSAETVSHEGFGLLNFDNGDEDNHLLEKQSYLLQVLSSFKRECDAFDSVIEIYVLLNKAIKRIIPVKEITILLIDENTESFYPLIEIKDSKIPERINHYNKEGIINVVFESRKPMILPELDDFTTDGPKLQYFVFPVYENKKKHGLLTLFTSVSQTSVTALDREMIQVLLDLALSKIERVRLKERLNSTYEELQTYQAKLSNDFRLAAIGELTDGIVEDIMSPLQVIMSYVDILGQDNNDTQEIRKIKNQVTKINTAINRLVKFSTLNQKVVKIQPCNINDVIKDYSSLVKSTIANLNLELALDFENNMPSILSHPNYIYQILTNLISMIKNKIKGNGGIIVQSRYKKDFILLRLISTANLTPYDSRKPFQKTGKTIDLNTRIVENLMNKHEGDFTIESYEQSGSTITLYFPLIRKIRK